MNTKICTVCREEKDISEYIKKCGMCRPCRTEHRKTYRQQNKEKFKEKDHRHYLEHKERIRQQQKVYYEKNSKKIQAQRKEERKKDPEKHREQQRKRYRSNLDLRLGLVYRQRVRREVFSGKHYLRYLGCTIRHLRKWFEFNFEFEDFSWDTYGKVWEIDHVIPCCKFDLSDEKEVLKCFNWKNTKPVYCSFNKRKNGRVYTHENIEQEIRLKMFEKTRQNTDTAL